MSAAKRLSKKQLRDDKFVDSMMFYGEKLRENQRVLVAGFLVLLIVILGLNWGRNAMRAGNVEAQESFSSALKSLEVAMSAEEFDPKNFDAPRTNFEEILAAHAGKEVGRWSMYYIAFCLEQQADFLVAEAQYNEYLELDAEGEFVLAAKLGIASCNAGVGRYKRQADFLVELSDDEGVEQAQADAWLYQAGQVYMDNGYFDLAREVLDGIKDRAALPLQRRIEQDLEAIGSLGS